MQVKGTRPSASRFKHMGRDAVKLSNGVVELVLEDRGSMTPVFGLKRPGGLVNAHWIPPFRRDDGRPYSPEAHAGFWKSGLLYDIAGDFLCSPSFGPGCVAGGAAVPPHGWTANELWRLVEAASDEEAAWAVFSLESPDPRMPLSWTRRDMVAAGEGAYYSSVRIRNSGPVPLLVNVARHTTLGPSFVERGCRISLSAERFMTPPGPSEFTPTGRLVEGAEFESLSAAPLRSGGKADLGLVPGMIGYTDFVTGAVPHNAALGWSCLANPELGLGYLCFFPGEAALPEGEIALGFNDLWMQYGGRPFTPWAEREGAPDRTLCLGTENATASFANGLEYARANPELLGSPTLVEIPARGERSLHYGAALVELSPALARESLRLGISDAGELELVGSGGRAGTAVPADFGLPRRRAL